MEEQRISFETATLAKDKGYDIVDYNHAFNPNTGYELEGHVVTNLLYAEPDLSKHLFRPTQSLLQKWLREKHNIHVECCHNDQIGYRVWTKTFPDKTSFVEKNENIFFNAYEEALEQGLLEALKLI